MRLWSTVVSQAHARLCTLAPGMNAAWVAIRRPSARILRASAPGRRMGGKPDGLQAHPGASGTVRHGRICPAGTTRIASAGQEEPGGSPPTASPDERDEVSPRQGQDGAEEGGVFLY